LKILDKIDKHDDKEGKMLFEYHALVNNVADYESDPAVLEAAFDHCEIPFDRFYVVKHTEAACEAAD